MKIVAILLLLIICYCIWQYFELKKFRLTSYEVVTDKIKSEIRLSVLADLHGFEYGEQNVWLIEEIKASNPHAILIAGDMIVTKYPKTYETALHILEQLVTIAPVYYSFGNHESRVTKKKSMITSAFQGYLERAEKAGIIFLNNQNRKDMLGEDVCAIGGCEIGLEYYEKKEEVPMDKAYLNQIMGEPEQSCFQILLAHNPAYGEQYADWGADLTFSGHNHGGLIYIPGIGSLISPQFAWFPKYDVGDYVIKGRHLIVSRGLGTHTFHIRIFNRAELVSVHIKPDANRQGGK